MFLVRFFCCADVWHWCVMWKQGSPHLIKIFVHWALLEFDYKFSRGTMRALYVNIVNPAKNDLFSRLTYYENEVLSIYCCPRRRRCLCNTGRSVTPPTNRYTKTNCIFFFVSYHLLLCADVAYFSPRRCCCCSIKYF